MNNFASLSYSDLYSFKGFEREQNRFAGDVVHNGYLSKCFYAAPIKMQNALLYPWLEIYKQEGTTVIMLPLCTPYVVGSCKKYNLGLDKPCV